MQKIHFRSVKCVTNPQSAKIICFSLIPGSPTRKKTHESVPVIMRVCRDKTWRWSRSEKSLACRQGQAAWWAGAKEIPSREMWSYSRASLALKTNVHRVNALETTRKDREWFQDWGWAKEPFAEWLRSGTEVVGSRGMGMAEDSAALGEGDCSPTPRWNSLNHLSHGNLCIVTPPKGLLLGQMLD